MKNTYLIALLVLVFLSNCKPVTDAPETSFPSCGCSPAETPFTIQYFNTKGENLMAKTTLGHFVFDSIYAFIDQGNNQYVRLDPRYIVFRNFAELSGIALRDFGYHIEKPNAQEYNLYLHLHDIDTDTIHLKYDIMVSQTMPTEFLYNGVLKTVTGLEGQVLTITKN